MDIKEFHVKNCDYKYDSIIGGFFYGDKLICNFSFDAVNNIGKHEIASKSLFNESLEFAKNLYFNFVSYVRPNIDGLISYVYTKQKTQNLLCCGLPLIGCYSICDIQSVNINKCLKNGWYVFGNIDDLEIDKRIKFVEEDYIKLISGKTIKEEIKPDVELWYVEPIYSEPINKETKLKLENKQKGNFSLDKEKNFIIFIKPDDSIERVFLEKNLSEYNNGIITMKINNILKKNPTWKVKR